MKSTKNLCRLLSLMLSVLLLFACMPLSAVAADTEFVSENLFQTHLESQHSGIFYTWANGEVVNEDTGEFWVQERFAQSGALAASVDGVTDVNADIWAFDYNTGNDNLVLGRYHLDDVYYCGNLVIYAGNNSKDSYFRVYASDTIEDLYTDAENIVSTEVICKGEPVTLQINREVKYISIVYDANATIANYPDVENIEDKNTIKDSWVAEFQLFTAEKTEAFVSENIFRTEHLDSINGGTYYTWANGEVVDETTGTFYTNTRPDGAGAFAASIDGVLTESRDMWSYDYDTSVTPIADVNLLVARYHLDAAYYIGNLVIYAGSAAKNEVFRVYASTSIDDLYTNPANTVTTNAVCDGTATEIAINRSVQYISIVYDSNATIALYPDVEDPNTIKDAHIFEIQCWTAEETADFISENLLQDESVTSTLTGKYVSGDILDTDKFDVRGALAGATDDELTTQYAVYGCLDTDGYEHPFYAGVMYTLAENEFVDNLKLYASGTFLVYAGDALDTLYSTANCVADMVTVSTTGTEIEINKYVKYLSIFCVGYADVVEFQLWSGEPAGAVVPDNTTLRVLTLGNSFSENTSVYASEIADNLGLELTFGYLKFPSCSIGQYLEAAQNDWSLFKFQYTSPNGTRTTVKNEASAFDAASSDSATHASIAEALNFTDWDVVVFQMDSYNSLAASSFDALPALIEYVKGFEPNAKLMLHEVWSWGIWDGSDAYKNFANIKANTEAAAIASDIAIIPSGLSFENAREALGSYTILNDTDQGVYQHANAYGCYVAGATYVATLFGVEIPANTFDGHTYVDNNGYVQTLNAAVNAAVKYYNSYGDANNNGEVENTDLVSLRKYLIGEGTVETTLADANYNGTIDVTDLIRIKKHLADVDVVLGPSK